ncbi:MAG: prepilin-type N-terminal cleavage/methylation domain-containing protein [Burkholderiales bacterium]|nr:prepilin-type N-terminal cleavage/methylation domain-containing protein [Burkholderiales bacterium]
MIAAGARGRGFSLFELAVAIAIIAAAATVLLERLRFYQEYAERVAMDATVRLVKTGLQIRLAELIVTNRQAEAVELESEDPTRWLDTRPANYAGEYRRPPRPGAWYFDAPRRQLVYAVSSGDRLELPDGAGPRELRFQARLLRDAVRTGGTTVLSVTGVTVVPVTPYRWSQYAPVTTSA